MSVLLPASILLGSILSQANPVARSTARIEMHKADGTAYACTGTLIAKDWILTAAHCLAHNGIDRVRVRFGAPTLAADELIYADAGTLNASYDAALPKADVALIHLSRPAPEGFVPAELATTFPAIGSPVVMAGYGIHQKPSDVDAFLRHATARVKGPGTGDCQVLTTTDENVPDGFPPNGNGYMGDSGGGSFVFTPDGKAQLIGVTHGSAGQGPILEDGCVMAVADQLPWIRKVLAL